MGNILSRHVLEAIRNQQHLQRRPPPAETSQNDSLNDGVSANNNEVAQNGLQQMDLNITALNNDVSTRSLHFSIEAQNITSDTSNNLSSDVQNDATPYRRSRRIRSAQNTALPSASNGQQGIVHLSFSLLFLKEIESTSSNLQLPARSRRRMLEHADPVRNIRLRRAPSTASDNAVPTESNASSNVIAVSSNEPNTQASISLSNLILESVRNSLLSRSVFSRPADGSNSVNNATVPNSTETTENGFSGQPITVIVNVLNRLRPNPPVRSILSAVIQALMLRNPTAVQSWRNIPFLVIIRSPNEVEDSSATGESLSTASSFPAHDPADILLDEEGRVVEESNAQPDYSIFVTDSRFFESLFSSSNIASHAANAGPENLADGAANPPANFFSNDILRLFGALNATSYEDLLRLEELIGYGHPLMAIEKVDEKFPAVSVRVLREIESNLPEKCTICLDPFAEEGLVRKLECKHVYHKECIDTWLTSHRSICPLCRRSAMNEMDGS